MTTTHTNGRLLHKPTSKIPQDATCAACRWYHPTPMHADECRRHAPVVLTRSILAETVWPETDDDDWCGEWEDKN